MNKFNFNKDVQFMLKFVKLLLIISNKRSFVSVDFSFILFQYSETLFAFTLDCFFLFSLEFLMVATKFRIKHEITRHI